MVNIVNQIILKDALSSYLHINISTLQAPYRRLDIFLYPKIYPFDIHTVKIPLTLLHLARGRPNWRREQQGLEKDLPRR